MQNLCRKIQAHVCEHRLKSGSKIFGVFQGLKSCNPLCSIRPVIEALELFEKMKCTNFVTVYV